ncbi:MAG: radical SAM protein [Abditibacteriota bacterium]|nr:radical SAM protein [Abditibacteriota bacterium]
MIYREKLKIMREAENYLQPISYNKEYKIALGFPNIYKIGMASLGFQIVWALLNQNPKVSCERFFLPEDETEPLTVESQRSIKSMSAIAFCVAFEMDYINILKILSRAKIPLLRQERDEDTPLIFVGGAITLINPFALSEFVDFFILGDGEEILDWVESILVRDNSKDQKLKLLSESPYIYVPKYPKDFYQKHIVKDLSPYLCHSLITTPYGEFGDTILFEISRGCGRGCRFCAAGHIQKPFRLRKPIIGENLPLYHSYGIVGAAVFDNPYSKDLCKKIVEEGAKFSLSSIRLETIDEEKLLLMKRGNIKTVTIAPEAGTERLREFIGKKCQDETIFNAIDLSYNEGFRKFKLYFMIGLPGETEEDIKGIINLITILSVKYPKAHFTPSCGSFVPKPHTRYENCPMDNEKSLKSKLDIIKKALNKHKNIEVSFESPRMAKVQAILSRADETLGRDYLLWAFEKGWTEAGREYRERIDKVLYDIEKSEFVWSKLKV